MIRFKPFAAPLVVMGGLLLLGTGMMLLVKRPAPSSESKPMDTPPSVSSKQAYRWKFSPGESFSYRITHVQDNSFVDPKDSEGKELLLTVKASGTIVFTGESVDRAAVEMRYHIDSIAGSGARGASPAPPSPDEPLRFLLNADGTLLPSGKGKDPVALDLLFTLPDRELAVNESVRRPIQSRGQSPIDLSGDLKTTRLSDTVRGKTPCLVFKHLLKLQGKPPAKLGVGGTITSASEGLTYFDSAAGRFLAVEQSTAIEMVSRSPQWAGREIPIRGSATLSIELVP